MIIPGINPKAGLKMSICEHNNLIEIGQHLTELKDGKAILYKTFLCTDCQIIKVKKYNVQYESELSFS